jgi:hypothetical protein
MLLRGDWRRQWMPPVISAIAFLTISNLAKAEVASIYGGSDGLFGSRTATVTV